MRRHFSAETLALHREGAVSARKAASIDAHLSVCGMCSGINSDLAAVTSVLAGTQLPPMPDALAERIQMSIASESAARAATIPVPGITDTRAGAADVASGAGTGAGTGAGAGAGRADETEDSGPAHIPGRPDLPERGGRRRWGFRLPDWSSRLVLRGLAAAGAVVIIAGAGLLFANGQSAHESAAQGGSGGRAPATVAPRPTAANGPGNPASHVAVDNRTSIDYRLKGKVATTTALISKTNFTRKTVASGVRKAVSSAARLGTTGVRPTSGHQAASKSVFGGIRIPALVGCLNGVADGRQVLVAEIARYLGFPATIIVLKSPTDPHVYEVAIVRFACSASNPHIIAKLTVPAG